MLALALRAAALALLAATGSCAPSVEVPPAPAGIPKLRVLVSDNLERTEITIRGAYQIWLVGETEKPRRLAAGASLGSRVVRAVGIDVILEDVVRTPCVIEFVPDRVPVEVAGRAYRGALRVRQAAGKLQLVNVLDLESYLCGVVPGEMKTGWPAAALQAQAIAARSYALIRAEERKNEFFDVHASVYDQKYDGLGAESADTTAAVTATAGQVLRYRGRPFMTWYHSCCGGATADAREVFAVSDVPLRGAPCGYCTAAPVYKWSQKLSRTVLAEKLRMPNLRAVKLEGIGLDGRVAQVTLEPAAGGPLVMAGTAFRERVGLRSTRFTVSASGNEFVFEGRGYGHGVGLCQWGAKGMAEAGIPCAGILERYYPGAVVVKTY